ncbi:MAG: hypothetical protein ACOY3P_15880, partial [Planctomycetota bacterium]
MDQPILRRTCLQSAAAATWAAGALAAHASSADARAAETSAATDAKASEPEAMPCGHIGKLKLSRMILGSNLMGGFSHARDLPYVASLMRAYNTEEKILETLALAEASETTAKLRVEITDDGIQVGGFSVKLRSESWKNPQTG